MATMVIDGEAQELPDDSPILETCEDLGVPFGCQAGQCATCVLIIEAGMENLHPKNQAEKDMGLADNQRLACQAKIKSGEVRATY